MWTALREAKEAARQGQNTRVVALMQEAQDAYRDWRDRTRLPRSGKQRVHVDPESDITLLYVNKTIYGEFRDFEHNIADSIRVDFAKWKLRGTTLKVTLYNGDYFQHGYVNVDFGGARGWENQFKSSVRVGGSGCWFTFGRAHWWMNNMPIIVPKANKENPYNPTVQKVHFLYNYEPSRRLRFYQFDPLHHDVAIFSIH